MKTQVTHYESKKELFEFGKYEITSSNRNYGEQKRRKARVKISDRVVLRNALKCYRDSVYTEYDRGKDPEHDARNLARLKVIRRLLKKL